MACARCQRAVVDGISLTTACTTLIALRHLCNHYVYRGTRRIWISRITSVVATRTEHSAALRRLWGKISAQITSTIFFTLVTDAHTRMITSADIYQVEQ